MEKRAIYGEMEFSSAAPDASLSNTIINCSLEFILHWMELVFRVIIIISSAIHKVRIKCVCGVK